MPTYKDIDAILRNLPDDLPYKASVKRVLMQAPEADVVPMSEYDDLKLEYEGFEAGVKSIAKNIKAAVAREIFEGLRQKRNELWNKGKYTMFDCWCKAEEELKKKYKEGK